MFTKALLKVDGQLILLLMTAGHQVCRRFPVAYVDWNPDLCSAQLQELVATVAVCCGKFRDGVVCITQLFDLPREHWRHATGAASAYCIERQSASNTVGVPLGSRCDGRIRASILLREVSV